MSKSGGRSKKYEAEEHAAILLSQAIQMRNEKKGNVFLTPSWLVEGELGSPVWITKATNSGREKVVETSFDRVLADGSNLLDPKNSLMLEAIQKSAILLRNGHITGSHMTPKRWRSHVNFSITLASYTSLHRARFAPAALGFSLFTLDDCKALLRDVCDGGLTKMLQCKERVIAHFHLVTQYNGSLETLLSDPDDLAPSFIDATVNYLTENKLFAKFGKLQTCISRSYLYEIVGLPRTGGNLSLTAFLRQFEPHLQSDLVNPAVSRRRLPSSKAKTSAEVDKQRISKRHFDDIVTYMKNFFKGHESTKHLLPGLEISSGEMRIIFSKYLNPGKHTQLIPITIGLDALKEAIHWVLNYGPAIVEATTYYTKKLLGLREWRDRQKIFFEKIGDWSYIDIESGQSIKLTSQFNITNIADRARTLPTPEKTDFQKVLQAFIGACAMVIGMLKPLRIEELGTLHRDCLITEENGGGSSLSHQQMKAGVHGVNGWISRAIPSLTAHAIQLLQVMGNDMETIFGGSDTLKFTPLFYFPTKGFNKPKVKSLNYRINEGLKDFCDMIQIPTDQHGRRLYIRVHEMRKFFSIVTHRHCGEAVLEILRMHLGHADRDHIFSYVAPDSSYDDLYVRYESECISDKLIMLENELIGKSQNKGLVALYESTRQKFNATSISAIPESEFMEYLQAMRRNDEFQVTTYLLRLEDYEGNVQAIEFAVKFQEMRDEKFDN